MQYLKDGWITQKKWNGKTLLKGVPQDFDYILNYTYSTSQPHTVSSILGLPVSWYANGSMTKQGSIKLEWDEENRLKGVTKSAQGVCFAYDASGERFYKNSGPMATLMVNGRRVRLPIYGPPVLYTSPYVVVTPNGYTKHYFVENERFASRIGDGNITGLNSHATTNAAFVAKQLRVNKDAPDSIPPGQFYSFRTLPAHWSSHHTTYWQHPDHLESANWVTDISGRGDQHLQYMPWGEPFVDQRVTNNTYNTRYTFPGKERDEETGYSYFGARLHNPSLSLWLSVDPMSDKYPGVSPYVYCAGNPVRLVDVDGREYGDYYSISGKWLGTDEINDNKAYVAAGKSSNGTFLNAKELPISNTELLDRATWVCGESGGSNELITNRVQNAGDASKTLDASVAEYYAAAINNIANTSKGGFYEAIKIRMSRKGPDGTTIYTSDGYFKGEGAGGNINSKTFAAARIKGGEALNADSRFYNSIGAVINSLNGPDPTGGCRAWLGGKYAAKYVSNPNVKYSSEKRSVKTQFSFFSKDGAFSHSFYRF